MHEFILCMAAIVLLVFVTTAVLLGLIGVVEGVADLIDHHGGNHE